MQWKIKSFRELTLDELYGILRLRCEIFIVEQVAYQDLDNMDQCAFHLFAEDEKGVCAYMRLFPKDTVYRGEGAFGRVCVRSDCRRHGYASEMLDRALAFETDTMHEDKIRISAQQYLIKFYESKGFVIEGEGYLEDGIPHISMVRQ